MKKKVYMSLVLLIGIVSLFKYFNLQAQIQEKQTIIDSVEDNIYNYALRPQALYNFLQTTINEPTREHFEQLAPLWRSTEYNLQSLITIHQNELDAEVYADYNKHKHNQVYVMFRTYANPGLLAYETKREDDLRRILKAWGDFSEYVKVAGGYGEIENPNQFTQEYTEFLKEIRIEWGPKTLTDENS